MFNIPPTQVIPHGTLVVIADGGCCQVENAIGVLKAITATEFAQADVAWGSGGGAIVAALLASFGGDVTELDKMIRTSKPKWFEVNHLKKFFGKSEFVTCNGLRQYLLDNISPNITSRAFAAVTEVFRINNANITGDRELLPSSAQAVLASCAFSGLIKPSFVDRKLYFNNGVLDTCPIPTATEAKLYDRIYVILGSQCVIPDASKYGYFGEHLSDKMSKSSRTDFEYLEDIWGGSSFDMSVIQLDQWTKSAKLFGWSDNFEQIDYSYKYALSALERRQ